MKYAYCTLAIGDAYLQSAIEFANQANIYSANNHHVIVAGYNEHPTTPMNTTLINVSKDTKVFNGVLQNMFNYNLKYFPLKAACEMGYDYIVLHDSDWRILPTYKEQYLYNLIQLMVDTESDICFERPHRIGDGKHNVDGKCFWHHKVDFYKLLDTTIYDEGHVMNEQFVVFKNSEKLKLFCDTWEQLYLRSADGDIWAYAEGVEMGMSMAVSTMKSLYMPYHYMTECYEFTTPGGIVCTRF